MIPVGQRIRRAVINYAAIVLVAASAFYVLNSVVPIESRGRRLFLLLGPAPALFSHLSVYEFGFYSLFVFPWLLLGGKRVVIGLAGFAVSWLSVGWHMWGPALW